jgi:dihydropteroate synthase
MNERRLPPTIWSGGEFVWGERTYVMAIINATPDSFSDDGVAGDIAAAQALAIEAQQDEAHIIDIGAESTRPGHEPLDAKNEIERLMPILNVVRPISALPISVDTSKARVAEEALAAGANMINDVRGFMADPELAQVVAKAEVPAVVMHDLPPDEHVDLVTSIVRELSRRLDRAVAAGVAWNRLIVDPGYGFGKDWKQNLELLRRLSELKTLDRPILVGFSRKSTIGKVLGLPENDRLEGTLATTALAIANGADIVRVHDVRENARVAAMTDAVVRGAPAEAKTWRGAS